MSDKTANTKGLEILDDDDDDENIQANQFLTFGIASETYAISILNVMEIIRLMNIIKIPETFDFIKGVINLRGKIIPVMDVRTRFNLPLHDYDDRTCIIVVMLKDVEMGLIVDAVSEVLEIPNESTEPIPKVGNASHKRFVKGIGKINDEVKIILDLDRLLFDEELKKIEETTRSSNVASQK